MSYYIPLFDIDSTLLGGDNHVHDNAFDYVFTNIYELSGVHKKDINTIGMTDRQIIYEILQSHSVPKGIITSKIDLATSTMAEYFYQHEIESKYTLLPGVLGILNKLKNLKIPMGLLTGNFEKIAWRKLKLAGIEQYFSFGGFGDSSIYRSDLIPIAKKNAELFLKTSLNFKDLIIIGDSLLDIKCAKAGGIFCIAVATGNVPYDVLLQAQPELAIHTLEEQAIFLELINYNPHNIGDNSISLSNTK